MKQPNEIIKTLSPTQRECLLKISESKYTAYKLRCRISTLYALEKNGLVKRGENRCTYPGTENVGIPWQLTPRGIKAKEALGGTE